MNSIRFAVVVLALALIAVFVAGEAGQTQGPGGSEPPAVQSSTDPAGEGGQPASTDGSDMQPEAPLDPAQSYNASLRIPAAALKPRDSDVDWQNGGEGGCVYATVGDEYTVWAAPLYLPDGATIRYFRMYYNDQHVTQNCSAWLTVYDLYGDVETEWLVTSSGTGQSYATTAELDHVVDYDLYNYVINWRPKELGSGMQVCGFKVFYYDDPWGAALVPFVTNGD